jgi:hypothetical protein
MSLKAAATATAWVCEEVRRRGHGRADVSLVSRRGTLYETLAAISSAPGLSTTPANWLRQFKTSLHFLFLRQPCLSDPGWTSNMLQ